ncbi:MAG: magnesium transporter CorA family protein [Hyphomicrobiaceae bacterium]|nr:magnesium transporter CorA family protein [Hyphomicrobiaceae bacterium]
MHTAFWHHNHQLVTDPPSEEAGVALWYDLLHPNVHEKEEIGALTGVEIPSREDMSEIETSSRLYEEHGAAYMTAIIPSATDTDEPVLDPVTFILTNRNLLTIRYHSPRSLEFYVGHANRTRTAPDTSAQILAGLLDAVVDRLADVLERLDRDIDAISASIFGRGGSTGARGNEFKPILASLGRKGDAVSRIRAALVTLLRLNDFLDRSQWRSLNTKMMREQIATLGADIRSLLDYANAQSQKIGFLFDATLGLMTTEQNTIIKFFSVVAVIFMPPTLIASLYGMNFHFMPELSLPWAYPAVLVLMLISAVLPFLIVKKLGWL